MICCGGQKIPNVYDKESLLQKLRKIDDEDDLTVKMKLSEFDCEFDQKTGKWNSKNFNKVKPIMATKYDEEIAILKQKLYEKEMKCEELEKLYLAKTVRLLYMAQAHCNLKKENENLFEKYGIKTGNAYLDLNKVLPNANRDNINDENTIIQSENLINNKKIRELAPA